MAENGEEGYLQAPFELGTLVTGDLDALVPDEYGPYRALVRSGLLYFASRLPASRRDEILEALRDLGPEASGIDRVIQLLLRCPTLHKLGQVVARDRRLSPELRRRLQLLEVLPPSLDASETLEIVERERGPLPPEIEVGSRPLAEASVAIVLPFQIRDPEGNAIEAVFKVLKPGVEERLAEELAIWSDLGSVLESESDRLGLPTPDYRDAVEQVRDLLEMEVQLEREQENLRRAERALRGISRVVSPRVLPYCAPRVTAMTRVEGSKITDPALRPVGRRLAERLVTTLIARPLLVPRGSALFHADPHAGNLLATADGQLGILDWALIGEIEKSQRIQITQILIGAMTLDPARVHRALSRLSTTSVPRRAVEPAIRRALRRLRRGGRPGLDWLFSLLDQIAFDCDVRFPGQLILFRKSVLTLRGVIEEISPGFPIDLVLLRETASQAVRDWPRRWFRGPFDRGYGLHLSNADVLRLLGAGPGTLGRYLRQSLRERRPS